MAQLVMLCELTDAPILNMQLLLMANN